MIKWVLHQLDQEDAERTALEPGDDWMLNFPPPGESSATRLERAKQLARAGNVGPLRALYPDIAEFIHPPKRKRGQRRSYHDPVALAARRFARQGLRSVVKDAKRTRALWKKHYGCWKRRRGQVSAEEIAGRRHPVPRCVGGNDLRPRSESEVLAAIKKLCR